MVKYYCNTCHKIVSTVLSHGDLLCSFCGDGVDDVYLNTAKTMLQREQNEELANFWLHLENCDLDCPIIESEFVEHLRKAVIQEWEIGKDNTQEIADLVRKGARKWLLNVATDDDINKSLFNDDDQESADVEDDIDRANRANDISKELAGTVERIYSSLDSML